MANKITVLGFLWCLAFSHATGQSSRHRIASKIQSNQAAFQSLKPTQLLEGVTSPTQDKANTASEVAKANFFQLRTADLANLLAHPQPLLKLELPVADGQPIELQLFEAHIFTNNFQVFKASDAARSASFSRGAYYWGIVAGDGNSLAAISVTQDEVMGFVSLGGENYVLGKLGKSTEGMMVFYKENDLKLAADFGCFSEELPVPESTNPSTASDEKTVNKCVGIYLEIDNDLVVAKGGVTQAVDFVNGVFSQVAVLYANEGINIYLNEIKAWDLPDPYIGPNAGNFLSQFRVNLNASFNGDIAHLVGTKGGGGTAYTDVLCNKLVGMSYSPMASTYANVPTYSWSVEAMAHEIGHNLGSQHTHACAWNGNNTPLDGCGPAVGYSEGCNAALPTNGGTIMSYCHLVGGVGINFANGFGEQPGNLIRSRVSNAACLSSCGATVAIDAGISSILSPSATVCNSSVVPLVRLENFGNEPILTAKIAYKVNEDAWNYFTWSGNLAGDASLEVSLPMVQLPVETHSFFAKITEVNTAADENPLNDASSSSFTCNSPIAYFLDQDGDGFGNAAHAVLDCVQPLGYVLNSSDCDDINANVHPGTPCSDGDICTVNDVLDENCTCVGVFADTDSDGVCDAKDVCAGGNDTQDADNDGVPNYCDCSTGTKLFQSSLLSHTGPGASSRTVDFQLNDKDPVFTISNLGKKTSGSVNSRYIEEVSVGYADGDGLVHDYGTFSASNYSKIEVKIEGVVKSISVSLADAYDGDFGSSLSVTLGEISYCQGCHDSDADGICDEIDQAPNFNNNLIGTACNDNDPCTQGDVWNPSGACQGIAMDSDLDGLCDALDICPAVANPEQSDADGDGLGDICDAYNCSDQLDGNFEKTTLTHTGAGASQTTVNLPQGCSDLHFSISNLSMNQTGGNTKKYTEQVTVQYVDGAGTTHVQGVYAGNQFSSLVPVFISGEVRSVTVSLTDGDGTPSSLTMSIDLSTVNTCLSGASLPVAPSWPQDLFSIYPNPTSGKVSIAFDSKQGLAEVYLSNMQGTRIGHLQVIETTEVDFDVADYQVSGQFIMVTVQTSKHRPITTRLILIEK